MREGEGKEGNRMPKSHSNVTPAVIDPNIVSLQPRSIGLWFNVENRFAWMDQKTGFDCDFFFDVALVLSVEDAVVLIESCVLFPIRSLRPAQCPTSRPNKRYVLLQYSLTLLAILASAPSSKSVFSLSFNARACRAGSSSEDCVGWRARAAST